MKTWKKVLIGGVSALTLAGGADWAAVAADQGKAASTVVDVKGPCDEAEHAGDPQCAGPQIREDDARERELRDDQGRERENRGREAEGEIENEVEDEFEDEAHEEDRSGPNRGPEDRSGHDDGADPDRGDDRGED
jgi:hypothetical protein